MDDLVQRLQNVAEAGSFSLNCDLHRLQRAAGVAGMTVFDADLSAAGSKGEFLACLAQAIGAPEWFGHNWDALADALCDLSWHDAPGYVLLLHNGGDMLGLSTEEQGTVEEILADVVDYWKTQGKPFWVFFC